MQDNSLDRPTTVTELRPEGTGLTTLSYDPISGAESSTYAATHTLLPGISLNAHAPDARGYATGFAVRQTGNELHAWTATNDAFGRMTSLVSGNQNFSFQAQPGTRRVREQVAQIGGAIKHRSTRGIDMLGRVTGMVSRAPDPAAGNVERMVSSAGHTYDDGYRRQNTRREDGTIWEFGYNDRSEVTSAVKQAANTQLVPGQSFAYGFDAMGNRTSTSAGTAPNVATSGYTPNALNQFSSITTPGKLDVLARSDSPASFQIDGQNIAATRVGNLYNAHANVANSPNGKYVSVSVTAIGSTQSGSRWLAPASVAPSYDADGNLKQDGRWSYTWDGENRLTKLETLASAITAGAPNLTISYTYDFRSRKLRETLHDGTTLTQDERTLYDGWNPVAEFKFHNSTFILHNSFLWGPDLSGTSQGAGGVGGLLAVRSATPVSGSSVFFPSYDTNGNIIAWSNESGQLIRRLDYDPFGNVVMKESFQGSTAELDQILKHGFSTKPQNPESGLLYYGYRFYDSQLGRWLNRDPIEEEGGVNLYGFNKNSAVNWFDPDGRAPISGGFPLPFPPFIPPGGYGPDNAPPALPDFFPSDPRKPNQGGYGTVHNNSHIQKICYIKDPIKTRTKIFKKLSDFSLFNGNSTNHTAYLDKKTNVVTFTPPAGMQTQMRLISTYDTITVKINSDASKNEVYARTTGSHFLVGKRTWGVNISSENRPNGFIYTNATEQFASIGFKGMDLFASIVNLNFERQVSVIWKDYLNNITDHFVEEGEIIKVGNMKIKQW